MTSNYNAVSAEGYEKRMGQFSSRLAHAFIGFTGAASGEKKASQTWLCSSVA